MGTHLAEDGSWVEEAEDDKEGDLTDNASQCATGGECWDWDLPHRDRHIPQLPT